MLRKGPDRKVTVSTRDPAAGRRALQNQAGRDEARPPRRAALGRTHAARWRCCISHSRAHDASECSRIGTRGFGNRVTPSALHAVRKIEELKDPPTFRCRGRRGDQAEQFAGAGRGPDETKREGPERPRFSVPTIRALSDLKLRAKLIPAGRPSCAII